MKIKMEICLKECRIERGISVKDLEKVSKVRRSVISKIERGESSPKLETMCKLCKALELKLDQVVKY